MSIIKRYIPRIILLDVSMLILLYALASVLVNAFGLAFRKWVLIVFLVLALVGTFAGVIQMLLKIKWKVLRILLICGFVAITVMAGRAAAPFVLFAFADEEYVVERDGNKYVAHVIGFHDTYVEYHEYKGPFAESTGVRIQEYYGEGSFDPIRGDHEYPVLNTVYFDEAGYEYEGTGSTYWYRAGKDRSFQNRKANFEKFFLQNAKTCAKLVNANRSADRFSFP